MAVTYRASPSKGKALCFGCHPQYLEVLSEKQFIADNRMGDDEGYWRMSIVVERCEACAPSLCTRIGEGICSLFGAKIDGYAHDICLTATQYAEALTSTMVGAVVDAKEIVQQGNIQLSNMRGNSIVGEKADIGEDTVYKTAIFEVWPYITALLSSDEANRSKYWAGCCCCPVRTALLREPAKFIPVRKRRVDRQRTILPEPNPKTADEQIYGTSGVQSQVDGVTYVTDEGTKDTQKTSEDALGIKFGPTTKDKKFWANTPNNVQRAVDERITEKHVDFDMTEDEREQLAAITEVLCEELRTSTMVPRIASWVLFGDLKSKKWKIERAEMALNVLMWQLLPDFQFNAAIKLEPMPDGKPPRMLIADGDAGAVMSALAIGVLERYLSRYHKHRMIKGKPKAKRMMEICRETFEMKNDSEAYEAFMMENDGSAWDTCCKLILRELTENKVLDVMFDRLYPFFTPYNMFREPRQRADRKAHYKLQISTQKVNVCALANGCKYTQDDLAMILCKRRMKASIDSIRRSGDRGTSILNWIVNLICWAWVLAGSSGCGIVHVNGKVCVDIFSTKRRFKIWLEGDDSLLWLTGRTFLPAELAVLSSRWTKLGHRPKLFQRTNGQVAEFCGWKIVVNRYGLDEDTACPDIPRMLENCFYSTAREAIDAAKDGDAIAMGRVVGPALIARAGSIAERVPSIARWLCRIANSLAPEIADEMFTRDDLFRLGRDDLFELIPEFWKDDDPEKLLDIKYGKFSDNVNKQVSTTIATNGLLREVDLATRHGWVRTSAEWYEFVTYLDAVTYQTADDVFRKIVPKGMISA